MKPLTFSDAWRNFESKTLKFKGQDLRKDFPLLANLFPFPEFPVYETGRYPVVGRPPGSILDKPWPPKPESRRADFHGLVKPTMRIF